MPWHQLCAGKLMALVAQIQKICGLPSWQNDDVMSALCSQPPLWRTREAPSLVRVGIAITFCYGALVVCYWAGLSPGRLWVALTTIFVLVLSYLYWVGSIATVPEPGKQRLVIGFAMIFAFLALLLPALHTKDLYCYLNLGWRQFRYGLNPYVHPIGDVPDLQHDPMITPVWLENPCPYGFLFALVTRWLVTAGDGHFRSTLLLFQLMNTAAYGVIAWLVVATRRWLPGSKDDSVLYLFLWNPLIILLLLADGHNDVLMALAMMLAMYAAARDRWLFVIPLLAMGALIKYSTAVVIPFAVIEMIRRRRFDALLTGFAISIGLFLWTASPYLHDYRHFQPSATADNLFSTANSLESVLYYPFDMVMKPIPALRNGLPLLHKILVALFALFGCAALTTDYIRYFRRWSGSLVDFVANALFAYLLLTCVLAIKLYPWYFGGFFPLALLLEEGCWLRNLTILISLTGLITFTPLGQAHIVNYLLMIGAPVWWIARNQWPAIERDLRVYPALGT
ncbi:MAG: hypothetical protein JO249_15570 [Acidobacteria bacterium]|nr:hypothetical protein [Acidobacteriota bacterium]